MKSTGTKRAILECTSMINNDEAFIHYTDSADLERHRERLTNAFGGKPSVRFERPVYEMEVEAGLDTSRNYTVDNVWDNRGVFPEVTYALDALYKLHEHMNFYVNTLGSDPAKSLVSAIASNFYDCMSGGCSQYFLAMCRHLIEQHQVSLNEEVYPKEDGWYTVVDFLEEIKDVPRFEHKLAGLNMKALPQSS